MSTAAILAVIFGACWGVCEALSAIPSIKANSIFQVIFNILSSLTGKTPPSNP